MSRDLVIRIIGISLIVAGISTNICTVLIIPKFGLALELGNILSVIGWLFGMVFLSVYGLLAACFGLSLVYNPRT